MADGNDFSDGAVDVNLARREYSLSRAMLYRLMLERKLSYTHVGRKRLISRKSIHDLLAAGLVTADAAAK
jgi:hypothetical protein